MRVLALLGAVRCVLSLSWVADYFASATRTVEGDDARQGGDGRWGFGDGWNGRVEGLMRRGTERIFILWGNPSGKFGVSFSRERQSRRRDNKRFSCCLGWVRGGAGCVVRGAGLPFLSLSPALKN